MSLVVGHETFSGGKWQMLALKDNNASHLQALVVGAQDFVLQGTQKEAVRWLADFKKPVKCTDGYGGEIWIILRGQAASVSEEIAKAYGSNFGGVGGLASCLFTGISALAGAGDAVGAAGSAMFNSSDINVDSVLGKLTAKDVNVRISCAKGSFQATAKDSIMKIPSGLSAGFCAGALASLKW